MEHGSALALSGGGFRAALFHCGALWRLAEVRRLGELKRISSVSGGSITAGVLALAWRDLERRGFDAAAVQELVVDRVRRFCARRIDVPSVMFGAALPFVGIGELVAAAYDRWLFEGATLDQLPDEPRFVFNSTNVATGVDFRFSKPYAGDYRIGLVKAPRWRLSLAVAASSAFPPFLSPVTLKLKRSQLEKVDGADLHDALGDDVELALSDGGVYDNLGLETVWNRYDTVLVSDGGEPFVFEARQPRDWLRHGLRALLVTVNQARSLRKRMLIDAFERRERTGTYWGIMTPIARYGVAGALQVPAEVTAELAAIRTRLAPFSEREQCALVNWGYAVCDAALRRWVKLSDPPQPRWPYPQFGLERGLRSIGITPHATADPQAA
jgi:NTE family protein